jgi:cytochrome c oxidase subunit III
MIVERSESIADVDLVQWSLLAEGQVLASHGWLRTLEETHHERPAYRYFLVRNAGELLAAVPCQLHPVGSPGPALDNFLFGRAARVVRTIGFGAVPALLCGIRFGIGEPILFRKGVEPGERKQALDLLLTAVAEEARTHLDPLRMAVFSLFLFSSSYTVWRAERSRRAGNAGHRRAWLAATILLGAIFLGGQAWEYAGLFGAHVGIGTSLFGSNFFMLTGFHGLHVLVGLLLLGLLLVLDVSNALGTRGAAAQQSVSVYWHFVDGVWVVIFGVVYVLTLQGMLA